MIFWNHLAFPKKARILPRGLNETFRLKTVKIYPKYSFGINKLMTGISPLHDLVTWHGINYAGTEVGLSKERKVGLDWYEFLCFGSPTALFASQHNFIPYHVTGSCKGPGLTAKQC